MKRNALNDLVEWKNSQFRKPLMLKGARQVGKTWLMKEFGRLHYEETFYFTFDKGSAKLTPIFDGDKDPVRIVEQLGLLRGKKILPGKHLIIFDEIQECPNALGCLKYFCEEANEYHVVTAGSLLGTLLAQPMSYPVGKVNLLDVYPLTFDEFLAATDSILANAYSVISETEDKRKRDDVLSMFHKSFSDAYDKYLMIGGMPECVLTWTQTNDHAQVARVQKEIIRIYENDIAKHQGRINSERILLVFRSIVTQLAKENEKFIYGCIKEGARAREFEGAIEWLVSAGLLTRTYNVRKPEHPLNVFCQLNHFKLFMFDTGLLKHLAGVSNESILLKSNYQFKGALTENYVLQQIRNIYDNEPKYYVAGNDEIDFLVQDGMNVIPIEVKSGENVKAAGSFKRFIEKHAPEKAIRFSKLPYRKEEKFTNVPLYLAGLVKELL